MCFYSRRTFVSLVLNKTEKHTLRIVFGEPGYILRLVTPIT